MKDIIFPTSSSARRKRPSVLTKVWWYHTSLSTTVVALLWISATSLGTTWAFSSAVPCRRTRYLPTATSASTSTSTMTRLGMAKRKKRDDADDMNRWYDSVDDDATPDDIFWQEMERQRLSNQIGDNSGGFDPVAAIGQQQQQPFASVSSSSSVNPAMNMGSTVAAGDMPPGSVSSLSSASMFPNPTMDQQKAADATLSEYGMYRVADNWLEEELQMRMTSLEVMEEDLTLEEETKRLMEQLQSLPDGVGPQALGGEDDEPWDHWAKDQMDDTPPEDRDLDRANVLKVKEPPVDSEFYLGDDPLDPEEAAQIEVEFWQKMEQCGINSRRLDKAAGSPTAQEYFSRPPDESEGFEHVFVSAIDNACYKSMVGNFRNYGVQFADNFGDWRDGRPEDLLYSIEDVASYKARKVYQATGLPCIASRTSFEIEPIPPKPTSAVPTIPGGKPSAATGINNPRVLSGYKVNDIERHVDFLSEALKPMSEPTRVTRFTSCLCFYDGNLEIFEYGVCDVDLYFCNSLRTYVSMAQALNNMIETIQLSFGLEYQKFVMQSMRDASMGSFALGSASLKLRDRVLKDGKVLPNDIIDVSRFMDSQVDVNLMDECAQELANRFMSQKPTKIVTVATTGLVIALPMAKYLQVPVVYARKERNVVMAETFQASFSSKTVGKNQQLLVSKSHILPDDRILVVDDFLSSGASQEALLRIISDAEATAVGVGVLLEKVYDSGRQSLSGFNIPIQSLCRVASVQDGVIQLVEETGFEQMKKQANEL